VAARLAAVLTVALLAFAAGCGGDDDEGSATADWANDLCSAITTWTSEVESAGESLRDDPTAEGLEDSVDELKEATETLGEDLRELERPDTESGDDVEAAVSLLADNLLSGVQTIDRAVEGAGGTTGTLNAISTIGTTVATMNQQVAAAWNQLQQADVNGDLERAFEEADSCAQLRSGS
jgi:hypothetical protein